MNKISVYRKTYAYFYICNKWIYIKYSEIWLTPLFKSKTHNKLLLEFTHTHTLRHIYIDGDI